MTPPELPRRAVLGGLARCCAPGLLRASPAVPGWTEVAHGLHVRCGVTAEATRANGDAIANTAFIVGRDTVAVFDPGGSLADGNSLRSAIRQHTALPISHVILSHDHPDHIFGAGAFSAERPVFVGHARLPAALAARGDYYRKRLDGILGAGQAGPVVAPTLLVADGLTIDLGGRPLVLTAHKPAHTDCDLSLVDAQTSTLLAGDLLFVNRVPSLDGDLAGWLAALAASRGQAAHAVPGHGPALVAWPAAAADLERYLTVLQRETRQAVARVVPIDQAARQVAQSERGRWALFDEYNGHNVIEAYHAIEWE